MIPEFTREATFEDLLRPAMDIAQRGDHEEAAEYVNLYVDYLILDWDRTPDEAQEIVLNNVGYFAGYFGQETRRAVREVFGASHPIIGDREDMTAEELFDAGFQYAQGIKP